MRRSPLLRWLASIVVLAAVATACGGANEAEEGVTVGVLTDVERAPADPTADAHVAGDAVTAFGVDLFGAVVEATGGDSNVIVSPASVAIALAMMEPGTVGDAQTQVRELLHIDDPAAFHASMSALEQSLEARAPRAPVVEGEDPGEVTVRVASSAFLQEGYPFESAYLEAIGRSYGPVLRDADFAADPDAVAHEINRFVADATKDRIAELIGDGVLSRESVLVLVNALYLKASWQTVFEDDRTTEETFTRLDGSTVDVPLMQGSGDLTAAGDGWVGASKAYVGDLAVQFVLPDEGRFAEVAENLAGVLETFATQPGGGAALAVPRFETRYQQELTPSLRAMGLTAPYERGQLLGIADDPRLVLDKVIHETYLAMDERGTEAAAATAAVFLGTGLPLDPPEPVVLDRPFLFRIYDGQTGATLFIGQVLDPTA